MQNCCKTQPQRTHITSISTTVIDMPLEIFSKKTDISTISLHDLLQTQKYTLLWSFPRAFTFVCPTEVRAFNKNLSKFSDLDCKVICFSTDSINCLKAWTEASKEIGGLGEISNELEFVGDRNLSLSRHLGCLEAGSGDCVRACYLIDSEKKIRYVSAIEGNVGRSVEALLNMVGSVRKSDSTGLKCPAEWKEGDEVIDVKRD